MKKYIKEYSVIAMLMLYVCAFAQPVLSPLGNNTVVFGARTIYVDTVTDLLYGGTSIISQTSPDTCFKIFGWNGTQASCAIPTNNLASAQTESIARFQNNLYLGGSISTDNPTIGYSLVRLGSNGMWQPATGTTNDTRTILELLPVNDTTMYIGGAFDTLSGVVSQGVLAYNGTQLHALPKFAPTTVGQPSIVAMAYYAGHLYAGGNINISGMGTGYNDLLRLDGNHWSQVGTGFRTDAIVSSMVVFQNKLIVAGTMHRSSNDPGNGCAAWDGTQWTAMDLFTGGTAASPGGSVLAIAVHNNELYASVRVAGIKKIVKWTGSTWIDILVLNTNFQVKMMASYKNELYIGGYLEYNGQGNHILRLTNLNATSNDFAANKLIVSPNPATNALNISIEGTENYKYTNKSVKIFDLQGKRVYETTFIGEKTELSVENLINGMYILQINSASQSTVGKFIINK